MHVCDAATGELLIHITGDGDTARGIAADFTEERGQEFSCFGNGNLYNAPTGQVVGGAPEQNFRIYWDGDIYEEIFNGIGNYHNQPYLVKYNQGRIGVDGKNLYEYGYSVTCNASASLGKTPATTSRHTWATTCLMPQPPASTSLLRQVASPSTITTAREPLFKRLSYRMTPRSMPIISS